MKSGIENPSKSEVIGRCGGDEKTEWPCRTDKSQTLKKQKQNKFHVHNHFEYLNIYVKL